MGTSKSFKIISKGLSEEGSLFLKPYDQIPSYLGINYSVSDNTDEEDLENGIEVIYTYDIPFILPSLVDILHLATPEIAYSHLLNFFATVSTRIIERILNASGDDDIYDYLPDAYRNWLQIAHQVTQYIINIEDIFPELKLDDQRLINLEDAANAKFRHTVKIVNHAVSLHYSYSKTDGPFGLDDIYSLDGLKDLDYKTLY